MKSRSYEKNMLITFLMILFFIIFLFYFFFILTYKLEDYQMLSCNISHYDVLCFPSVSERKIIYANKYLYVDDKKLKYKIIEDKGIVLENNGSSYYEMVLQFDIPSHYKEHDIITMSIQNKRIQLFKIIQDVLEGD